MKYAGLKKNDATNCLSGICTSLWMQGCPHRCNGCHNPETWDKNGGIEIPEDLTDQIIEAISANGIMRSFSILGGEPLADWNKEWILEVVKAVRERYSSIEIYLWTGWTLDHLLDVRDPVIMGILDRVNYVIDGQFEIEHRNITLPLRGSKNQLIWKKSTYSKVWTNISPKYS